MNKTIQEGVRAFREKTKNPYKPSEKECSDFQRGYYSAMGAADRQLGREYFYFNEILSYTAYDEGWTNPGKFGY